LRPLERDDLPAATVPLARYLIGRLLVRDALDGRCVGRIVETEAYEVGDPSSHAFRRQTRRNASMFLRRGHAYVYTIYGTSYCLNVSSESVGEGAAILIRAVEPLEGISVMRSRRPAIADRDLARGPGRLCTAFAIDPSLDGVDVCAAGDLALWADDAMVPAVGESTRIGLSKAVERLHRFYARGSVYLSGPRRLSP